MVIATTTGHRAGAILGLTWDQVYGQTLQIHQESICAGGSTSGISLGFASCLKALGHFVACRRHDSGRSDFGLDGNRHENR